MAYLSQPGGTTDGNAQMQYLSLPALTITSAFSVCAWFYPLVQNAGQRVFEFGNTGPGNNIIAWEAISPGPITSLRFSCFPSTTENFMLAANGWTVNTWQHLCLVVSGNSMTGYLNGQNAGSSTLTSSFPGVTYASGNSWIGRSHWADPLYKGYMDEIRVFNKALTAAEVSAVYSFRGDSTVNFLVASCPTITCTGGTIRCTPSGASVCCTAGQYFVEGVSSTCQPCAAGTYGFGNATSCTPVSYTHLTLPTNREV